MSYKFTQLLSQAVDSHGLFTLRENKRKDCLRSLTSFTMNSTLNCSEIIRVPDTAFDIKTDVGNVKLLGLGCIYIEAKATSLEMDT